MRRREEIFFLYRKKKKNDVKSYELRNFVAFSKGKILLKKKKRFVKHTNKMHFKILRNHF